jgi:hypothetical protein
MGGSSALAVMALHPKLSHTAMRLLVHMAATSLDPGQRSDGRIPCCYWAGQESQILAMGWRDMSGASARRKLRRLRTELIAAGAIIRIGVYHRHPVFLLVTGSEPDLATAETWARARQHKEGRSGPPKGGPWRPPIGGP